MSQTTIKPWYKKPWAIIGGIIILLFFVSVAMSDSDNPETTSQPASQTAVVFDLEVLHGKNIDEIRTALGTPTDGAQTNPTADQLKLGTTEWSNTFKKDGYELLVTYNPNNKNVTDFFLSAKDGAESTKDMETLKDVLNVKNAGDYTVESVKQLKDPSKYTGIKATVK